MKNLNEMTAKEFVENLFRNHSRWDFFKFAEMMGVERELAVTTNAWLVKQWEAFTKLAHALGVFDEEDLAKIGQGGEQ